MFTQLLNVPLSIGVSFFHELAFSNITRILKVVSLFSRSIILTSVFSCNWFQEASLAFILLLLYCIPFHMKEM